jgi:tRNA dimethylallyltransferase
MPEATPVVALFGATALGKTEGARVRAERRGAEIVAADAMQVYAGLSILTNQPNPAQRARAIHHLVGVVSPQEEFSVAAYARLAHEAIDRLRSEGTPVVVEGGSGLYLRAALGDLTFAGPPDDDVRREFEVRWERDPAGVLDELRAADPGLLASLDAAKPAACAARPGGRARRRRAPAGHAARPSLAARRTLRASTDRPDAR